MYNFLQLISNFWTARSKPECSFSIYFEILDMRHLPFFGFCAARSVGNFAVNIEFLDFSPGANTLDVWFFNL